MKKISSSWSFLVRQIFLTFDFLFFFFFSFFFVIKVIENAPHFCTEKYFLTKRNHIDDPVLILSPNMLNELCFYKHKIKIRLIYKYCSRFLFNQSFKFFFFWVKKLEREKKENLDFFHTRKIKSKY